MRIAYSYLVLAAVAGMASMVSAAGINPTQGDMSDGASDWGLVNGTTVSSAAQSPFTNAFPDNGAGLVLPAGLAFFTPAFDRSFTPKSGTALINMDLLIVGSSTEHHFLEIKGDTGNPIRLAIGTGFGAPIVLWDGASGRFILITQLPQQINGIILILRLISHWTQLLPM